MKIIKNGVKSILSDIKLRNLGFQHDQPDEFYRSMWQSDERSGLYLIYRWAWAIFFTGLFMACMVLQFANGKLFIFLTNWGILMCLVTNFIGAILVTRWHFDIGGERSMVYIQPPFVTPALTASLNKSPTKQTSSSGWVRFYWLLHTCTLTLALIITTVYWTFLHGKMNKPMRFPMLSFCTHGLNSVFMVVDLLIVAFPTRLLHTIYAMLVPIFYCLFTVLYYFCGGTDEYGNHWVYPILDWTKPGQGMTTFAGVFILYVIYGLIMFLVYKAKRWFHRTLLNWRPHSVGLI